MKIHDDIRYQKLIRAMEIHHIAGDEGKMRETLDHLQNLAEADQDPIGLSASYFYRGLLAAAEGQKKDKITYMEKVYALATSKKIPYYEMKAHNTLGIFYSEDSDFYTSLKSYLKAYHIAADHPEYKYESIVLNNIGNIFVWLNEYEAAVTYLERAYTKFIDDQIKDRLLQVLLIVNIVEMYSGIKDYEKVVVWANKSIHVDFTEDERLVLTCILTVNEMVIATDRQDFALAQEKAEDFMLLAAKSNDFIYIFRCYMNALTAALTLKDEALCATLIQSMQLLNDNAAMDTFFYDFATLKVQYQKLYFHRRSTDTNPDFDFYYIQSSQRIKQLENTYARSLFAEIELDKSRFENQTIIKKNQQLQKDIERDPFTGLYNKPSTIKHVERLLKKRGIHTLQAMLIVDIDFFKNVNDFYGHDYGDTVISQIADILKSTNISRKIVGRFGGDEYLVFFPSLKSVDMLQTTLDALYQTVYKIQIPDERIEKITLSIGVGLVNNPITFDQLFKTADQALYHAKRNGRNCYEIYASDAESLTS